MVKSIVSTLFPRKNNEFSFVLDEMDLKLVGSGEEEVRLIAITYSLQIKFLKNLFFHKAVFFRFLCLKTSPTLNFPLFNQVSNVVVNEVDFNPEFISRMIPKVEWAALLQAAEQVGFCTK